VYSLRAKDPSIITPSGGIISIKIEMISLQRRKLLAKGH
jgi:hypothetical protein